jgi:hypothetical protein
VQISQSVRLLIRGTVLVALGLWLAYTYIFYHQLAAFCGSIALLVMALNDAAAIRAERSGARKSHFL